MKKGFTLLEILLVIAAIGVIAAIVIVAINPNRQLAQVRDAERQSEVNNLHKALEQYLIDSGEYPTGVSSVSQEICAPGGSVDCIDLSGDLVPTYLASIPVDSDASGDGSGYLVIINSVNDRIGISSAVNEIVRVNYPSQGIPQDSLLVYLDSSLSESYPGTGTEWFDISGNDNHATLHGGAVYVDAVEQSIYTDGSNDYVRFTVSEDIVGNEPWSISIWKRVDSSESGGGRRGWSVYQGPFNQSANQLIGMGVNSGSLESAHWANDYTFSSHAIDFDEWHHYVLTYDGLNTEILFVDGVEVETRTTSQLNITSGTWHLGIRSGGSEALRMHVGHFALYDRTLSEQEIQGLFQQTRGRFE